MQVARVLAALIFSCGSLLPQDPDGWRRNDIGRDKVLIGPKAEGEEIPSVFVTWQSPAIYGDRVKVMKHYGKVLGTSQEEYRILGIENESLKLSLHESSQRPPEKGLKVFAETTLSIPKYEGAYTLYSSHSISEGFGFRVTPNSPKAGLLDVQLFWDKLKK
jgi:hypothetical protein